MVGAGGGGGDEADGRAFEEVGADMGFRADDQGIGVLEVRAGDLAVGNEDDVAQAGKRLAGVQDAGGANDFHGGAGTGATWVSVPERALRWP